MCCVMFCSMAAHIYNDAPQRSEGSPHDTISIMMLDIEQHIAHMFLVCWCKQTVAWPVACKLHDSVCMQWCTWPLIPIINSTTGLCLVILCICIVLFGCNSTYKTTWLFDSVLYSTGKAAWHVCLPPLDCPEAKPRDSPKWHRFRLCKYILWCSHKESHACHKCFSC